MAANVTVPDTARARDGHVDGHVAGSKPSAPLRAAEAGAGPAIGGARGQV